MKKYQYLFFGDYSEGAHPLLLKALLETNQEQVLTYGEDCFSEKAIQLIREKINNPEADVYFVSTGTQANLVGISWLLKTYESVIAVESGHICVHEAGAIEATGHKVHTVPGQNGKLTPQAAQEIIDKHDMDQMVKPRAVYLSQATEVGTVYNQAELLALTEFCKKNNLYLYIDGARLGHALMIENSDIDLPLIAQVADIFYIGGTKNGGLMGEAMVITHPELKAYFRFHLRQRGALLAKARTVSVQFIEFFKGNLYFDLARHANNMALRLARGIEKNGYDWLIAPSTNQLFPILPNDLIEKLHVHYGFYQWSKVDEHHSAIRLVTSWATPLEAVDQFIEYLNKSQ